MVNPENVIMDEKKTTILKRTSGPGNANIRKSVKQGDVKPTVLVVDDDKKIIEAFKYLMESENLNMISASNVDEVMERIEGKDLDLIITDFMLETKSSIELFTLIRKSHPEVPVVVMTGYPELISEKDVKNFGGNYLLTKPLELTKLRGVIRTCCNPLKIASY
ncbi:MAG: response regulator [Bacteroidota bacterium]|nr:response regulator [Bacteroidota bacterium]MDP4193154.1 response regulator [Bacteroidota bacterium]MDP4196765.1 response regulator [Bacteroidota bacterium]